VGVATTLFCAVTVCKMAYDGWLAMNDGNPKKISI
jgi:hypothetical protein